MERERALGLDRGDVDQCPTSFSFEVGQRCHRSVYLSHEVHVCDALELLRGRLLEGGEEPHRGEVHPGVEPPVLLYGAVGHGLDLLEVCHLGGYGRGLSPLAPYLFDKGVQPLLAPGRNDYFGAPFSEPEGGLPSYAAGGTHQCHNLLLYWLMLHTLIAPCS